MQSNKEAGLGNFQDERCLCLLFTLRFHMRFQTRIKNLLKLTVHFLVTDLVWNLGRNINLEHRLGRGSLDSVSVFLGDSSEEVQGDLHHSMKITVSVRPKIDTAWSSTAFCFSSARFSWQVFALPGFIKELCY